jgi:hypothetical protein
LDRVIDVATPSFRSPYRGNVNRIMTIDFEG